MVLILAGIFNLMIETKMILIRMCKPSLLLKSEVLSCKKLTLKTGIMRKTFEKYFFSKHTRVILAYDGKDIIAWSLLFVEGLKLRIMDVHVFVKPSYRRNGIGTFLIKRAVSYMKYNRFRPRVWPWEEKSDLFYENLSNDKILPAKTIIAG